ncbi:MAG: hypothetical protein KIH89_000885 [Candidatus Shapirobacteria bacterium]|nr:hypothetical protein [Candidatus Shapirobacteria bacterium]
MGLRWKILDSSSAAPKDGLVELGGGEIAGTNGIDLVIRSGTIPVFTTSSESRSNVLLAHTWRSGDPDNILSDMTIVGENFGEFFSKLRGDISF